jgi:hypothetical protein
MRGRIADILGMIKFSLYVNSLCLNTKQVMALLFSTSCRRFRETCQISTLSLSSAVT